MRASPIAQRPVRLACCLIIAAAVSHAAFAQARAGGAKFRHITVDQGLSQNFVYTMLHDSKGYMWFGTRDGLNKFDGYTFTCFKNRPFVAGSIPSNVIRGLAEDSSGAIWIATQRAGLVRFDRKSGRFINWQHDPKDPNSFADDDFGAAIIDRLGFLWVSTFNMGLYRVDIRPGSIRFDKRGRPLPLPYTRYLTAIADTGTIGIMLINAMCRDARGDIWAAADNGLLKIDPVARTVYHNSAIPWIGRIGWSARAIAVSRAGTLWIATSFGLVAADPTTRQVRYVSRIPDVRGCTEDATGLIWFGSIDGVYSYDPATGNLTHNPFGRQGESAVVGSMVLSAMTDRDGQIWIGTDGGVNMLDRAAHRFDRDAAAERDYSALDPYSIRSIVQGPTGMLWIGTAGNGVLRFDPVAGTIVSRYVGTTKNANFVNSICQDHNGKLWFGLRTNVAVLEGGALKEFEFHGAVDADAISNVWSVYEDRRGTMWLGSMKGLMRFDPATGVVKQYRHDPADTTSIAYNGAWTVLEDSAGNFWVGTPGGLDRLDRATGRFTHFRYDPANPASLSHNEVWELFEDRKRTLWIGTWGGGLNRFDPRTGRFQHFTEANGPASNTIHGIRQDSAGYLWISTGGGISKLDPHTGIFTNFGVADGLPANEYNPNACCRMSDGEIVFGGIYGVTHFDPAVVASASSFTPPVVITSFRKLDSLVASEMFDGADVNLAHDENYCSFEFAALDYTNPGRIRYAYMLEGLDRDWVYSGARRYVAYTNLDPGEYTFRVKATNSDGFWSEKGITIHVHVIPPFWRTWLFRTCAIAMLGLGALGWYVRRARRRRQLELALDEAREIERREIAAELHDGPLQDLYSLRFILEPLAGAAGIADGTAFERIDETLRKVRGSLRNVCGDLQLPSFECGLDMAIAAHAERLEHGPRDLDLQLELMPEQSLTQDVRRNLFRAYRSAINNVLKHADATRIIVRLRHDSRSVVLEVEDNGRGFRPPRSLTELMRKKHYGLLLIDAHARSMGGTMEMRSNPGEGALIRVTVDMQKLGARTLRGRFGISARRRGHVVNT